MRTEDLIAALAQDPAATPLRLGRIGAAVIGIIALCVGVFLTVIGLRADLATVLTTPLLASKTLLPAVLSLAALPVVVRLMRPEETGPVLGRAILWTALAVAALLYAVGFATQSRAQWFADVSPASVLQCLGFILLISLPALGLCFALVRQGATTAPARSGAMLGLAVSAGATAGYSLYCTQDNPIFFVTWYGLAILIVTILGAVAGTRLLRW